MSAKFICHPDFACVKPKNVFHKEMQKLENSNAGDCIVDRHILFCNKFSCKNFASACIKISADDYYKLYVNGKFVCMGPAPGYPWKYNYNAVDITEYLEEGENFIAVHTYYQGLCNRVWVSGDLRQMFWCELECDGKIVLVSDESWKCSYHGGYEKLETIGYDTGFNEKYDCNSHEIGFEKCGYDYSYWNNAAVCSWADYVLFEQKTLPVDVYEILPQKVKYGDDIFVDFGREAVGYLKLIIQGEKDDEVIIRCGEELLSGKVRYEMRCNCIYRDIMVLSGKEDVFEPFDYKSFRYAEISVPKNVKVISISMIVRHYPYVEKHLQKSDSVEIDRILRLCADTIKYGTQDNFVDCPTREKGQYLGDIMISGRAQAILTQNTDFVKKAVSDFFDGTKICKGLMAVSCCSLMQEIADYSLEIASLVRWIYEFDHDIDFLKYAEPYLTGVYEYFLKYKNQDGLLEEVNEKWNLVDWPANYRDGYAFPLNIPIGKGVHNVINALWCGFLRDLNKIYRILGKEETREEIIAKKAYIDAFYLPEVKLYCDSMLSEHCSVHSNIFALLYELYDDKSTENSLIDFIARKKLSSVGVYIAYFALAAIKKHVGADLCKELILDDDCWKKMLSEGATTTFEAWSKDGKWNTSLFHPWAVAPIIVLSDCEPF